MKFYRRNALESIEDIIKFNNNHKNIFFCTTVPLLLAYANSAAAAGIPGAAQITSKSEDVIATIQNEAIDITQRKDNEAALSKTKKDIVQTQKNIADTEILRQKNISESVQANKDLVRAEESLHLAQNNEETAKYDFYAAYYRAVPAAQEADDLQNDIVSYQADYDAAAAYVTAVAQAAKVRTANKGSSTNSSNIPAYIESKLAQYNYDENALDSINEQLYGQEEEPADSDNDTDEDDSTMDAAEDRLNQAQSVLEDAQEHMDELQSLIIESDELKKAWDETREDLAAQEKDTEEQKKYVDQLAKDLTELNNDIAEYKEDQILLNRDADELNKALSFYHDSKTVQTTYSYYTWRDKKGNKGHQYINQTNYNQTIGKWEFGINFGSFKSNNESNKNGSASGLLDTGLHVGLNNFHKINKVSYNMDVNIPTGKNNLSSATAMSTDLVPYDSFGSGWQFSPSIRVKHMISDVDYILYGAGMTFNGSYNYNKQEVNPGTEFLTSIGWLHAAKTEQFLSQLFLDKSARSQDGNIAYRNGNDIMWENTYNKNLSAKYAWPSYIWFGYNAATDYYGEPTISGSQTRIFYGTGVERKISNKEKIKLMFHGMHSTGNDYDPVTELAVSGRDRYAAKLSYEKRLNEKKSYSISLENFYMKDKGNNKNSYRGTNIMFTYNVSF